MEFQRKEFLLKYQQQIRGIKKKITLLKFQKMVS